VAVDLEVSVGPNLRFAAVVVLLTSAAWFLMGQSRNEVIPQHENLASFPHQFGPWMGSDVNVPQGVLDVLGPGEFLFRNYQDDLSPDPLVNLFIAYFPSQRVGDTIHSPKNCLPGAGWIPLNSNQVEISLPPQKPFLVNRYLLAKGAQRDLVLYWYWAHSRTTASEYRAKFYLIADSIRLRRSDGSLIRVTTQLKESETEDAAQERLLSLLRDVVPRLESYLPR
jgi:EpsI family protein